MYLGPNKQAKRKQIMKRLKQYYNKVNKDLKTVDIPKKFKKSKNGI